jgi:hypothetical protein
MKAVLDVDADHARLNYLGNVCLDGGWCSAVSRSMSAVTGTCAARTMRAVAAMVVTFAAGGGNDVLARIVAPRMGELLGQQVVMENVPGAGGMTGGLRVVRATPDGYRLCAGQPGHDAIRLRRLHDASHLRPAQRRHWCPDYPCCGDWRLEQA